MPGQVGAVFSVDGEPAGVEHFDAPRTLRSTLGRLVESYALDAIGRDGGTQPGPDAAGARGFLLRAAQADAAEGPALGEGVEIRLEAAGLVGEALAIDGRLVHLSALPLASTRGEAGGRGEAGRAAPSARDRAERLRWRRAG